MHTAHSRTHTCNGRSGSNAGRRNREHSTAFYPLTQPFCSCSSVYLYNYDTMYKHRWVI